MKSPDSNVSEAPAKAQRRTDLENVILYFDAKTPVDHVYFYDEQPVSAPFDTAPFRLVAVTRPAREVYRLSGFDALPGPSESLREFNRLTSTLQISVLKERAVSLAGLFLNSTDPAGLGEIALDDDAVWLRLAVQNHYFTAFGDVWRALEAYAGWWEQFRATARDISPLVTLEGNGCYRVTLKRLVRYPGSEPEVQNWELEVSRKGEIRVLSKQVIFPVHAIWLFYDFR